MRTTMKMVCLGMLFSALVGGNSVRAFTLVEDGKPTVVIVIRKSAAKITSFAARELQTYLQKMSGATLEIREATKESDLARLTGSGSVIHLDGSDKAVPPDGFRIACDGKTLTIAGQDDSEVDPLKWTSVGSAGTLYGVYRLLEHLGVRWYFPGEVGEVVPQQTTVLVSDGLSMSDTPYFPFRLMEPPLKTPEGSLWLRRVGFGATVYPAATCHSFSRWYKQYAETHPELFALRGGKRIDYICFYGNGVRQRMIADAKAYLQKADPQKFPYFTVMENDGAPGPCECAECRKRLTPERGWYGLMSDYNVEGAVEVAQAIKDEFPDRGVCIGAYNEYTRSPIRFKQLPANVGVQIFRHRQQMWSEEARKNIYAVIEGWIALKPKTISFWDYYNFDCWRGRRWLGIPAVTTRFIAQDIQRLKQMSERSGVRVLGELTFCNGRVAEHHPDRLWWLGLDMYVTGKCLWNPDLNREELLREFYVKFFGPAAGPMEKLYSRAEEVWVKGDHGGRNFYCADDAPLDLKAMSEKSYISADPWKCLFTPEVLKELKDYMEQARTEAKDAPFRQRVEMVGKGLDFTLAQSALLRQ